MIRGLFALSVVSVVLATSASAQEAVSLPHSRYTHSELKQLIREAHTPEQYSALAGYYTGLQREYLRRAEQERQEWEQLSKNVTWRGTKAPTSVDFSRQAYEYDLSRAAKAESAAAKYGQLAAPKSSSPAS
jgi:hypothetical protein